MIFKATCASRLDPGSNIFSFAVENNCGIIGKIKIKYVDVDNDTALYKGISVFLRNIHRIIWI